MSEDLIIPRTTLDKDANELSLKEIIELAAIESVFFSRTFFPRTMRLSSPDFHYEVWDALESTQRLINIIMSRGFAKTSLLRVALAKRIAYNISRTILVVGASETHSRRTIRWLRKQVEQNKLFYETFQLSPGVPWTDTEAQILHGIEGDSIWLTGLGITSSSGRGINFDDYRPDLILLDDVMNDENVNTKEGRQKIANLVFGAFKESLAPRSESPLAKMVMLNTPQDYADISQEALKDPQFLSIRRGCWTPETEDLPLEFRKSAWEELISTADLQEEYLAAQRRNKLSIFIREKECKLTTPETSTFREEWLQYYGDSEAVPEPDLADMWTILIIDPVPPPSEIQLAKGLADTDFEALTVLGKRKNQIFVLETVYNRGHTPAWTIAEFFRLAQRWNIRKALVEAVAYQKTLMWLLRTAMQKAGTYYMIEPFGTGDKRSKDQKIVDGLLGITSNRQLYVRRDQAEFIEQFRRHSLVRKVGHDDVIETVAIGCSELINKGFNLPGGGISVSSEDDIDELDDFRGCP